MRVQIYYNLHKKCLSVRHKGKVIKHADSVLLEDVKFRVQPAGRAKVLREKRKNVHAYLSGELAEGVSKDTEWLPKRVSYNPYKYETFVDRAGNPVFEAETVLVKGKEIFAICA